MHEARWSRAKADAGKRRTGGSTFRAAISNARNERTSPLWARAALFGHAAAPGQARAAPVEHSAPPGWLERHTSSILRFRGRLERHPSSILRLRGQTRAALLEYSAALGRARAAISRHLRIRGGLEQPFRAICGSGPGSSGQMQPNAANSDISSQAGWRSPEACTPKLRNRRGAKQTLMIDIYIYIYIYTRFAYGTLRCL